VLEGKIGDVHYERGMSCIDCHTLKGHHGDGYLYEEKVNAVEIRCVTCHGTMDKAPDIKTVKGNSLDNIKKQGDRYVLVAKLTGKEHEVPVLKDANHIGTRPFNRQELERISRVGTCMACHAKDGVDLAGKAPNDMAHQMVIRKSRN